MVRALFFVLILMALKAGAQTSYPGGVQRCVGRWNFTLPLTPANIVPDVSGNGNNGTSFNLVAGSGYRGLSNRAMQFNGTNSYVLVSNNTQLQMQNLTMVALVNLDTFYSGVCQNTSILSKGTGSFDPGMYSLDINDNMYDNNNCQSYNPGFMQLSASLAGASFQYTAANYITLRQWYLMLVSYDGDTAKLYQLPMDTNNYISNVTAAHIAPGLNNPLGINNEPLMFGKMNNTQYPYWLNGRLDEIALFDTTLNRDEVQQVYDFLWGKAVINIPFTDTVVCAGDSISVPFSISDHLAPGNIFRIELSSATGSFANPVTIGMLHTHLSGTIKCAIPPNTVPGNGYRVRVVPSNPVFTSRDNGINIRINPALMPSVLVSASPGNLYVPAQPVTFTAFVINAGATTTYQWMRNGAMIPGATANPYVTSNLSPNDTITAVVQTIGTCISSDTVTSNFIIMVPTHVAGNLSVAEAVTLFPNPSRGAVSLRGKMLRASVLELTLLTTSGKIVAREQLKLGQGTFLRKIFPETELGSGVYLVRITDGEEAIILRLVVQD